MSVDSSKKSSKKSKPKKGTSKTDLTDDMTEEERREAAKSTLFGFFKSRPTIDALQERGLIPQGNLVLTSFYIRSDIRR